MAPAIETLERPMNALKKTAPGFVVFMVMALIAMGLGIVTLSLSRITRDSALNSHTVAVQKARKLALFGLTIVQSAMTHEIKNKKDRSRAYEWLLENLNSWQSFDLAGAKDSATKNMGGSIKLYVACEDGKLNLNNGYDAAKKKFDTKKNPLIAKITAVFSSQAKKENEAPREEEGFFTKLLAKKTELLEDQSQLFDAPIDGQKTEEEPDKKISLPLFPEPPAEAKNKESGENKQGKITLTVFDLCTIAPQDTKIDPVFLSASLQQVAGLTMDKKLEEKKKKDAIKKLAAALQNNPIDWRILWQQSLETMYGKPLAKLDKELLDQFQTSGRAKRISVVCYGKFGSATQKIYAILRESIVNDNRVVYSIEKLYWIT